MMQEINPSVKESILKTAEHLDDLLHHGKQVQAYFVAGIFVLQIGAVRHVGLPDTFPGNGLI